MDGHHRLHPRRRVERHIGRRQARLPVVTVQDIRLVALDGAARQLVGSKAQRREALPVVRPVLAVGTDIGVTRPVVEMRRIDGDHIEPVRPPGHQPGGATEKLVQPQHLPPVGEARHHLGVARQQHPHGDTMRRQRRRQRANDVGEPTRLDQRVGFRGDGQDFDHGGQLLARRLLGRHDSLSIIGWVTSVTPSAVRRNHCASNSGSSPTTSPSGIMHSTIDHDLFEPRSASDGAIGQHNRLMQLGIGVNARCLSRAASGSANRPKRCNRPTPGSSPQNRGGRRNRARTWRAA